MDIALHATWVSLKVVTLSLRGTVRASSYPKILSVSKTGASTSWASLASPQQALFNILLFLSHLRSLQSIHLHRSKELLHFGVCRVAKHLRPKATPHASPNCWSLDAQVRYHLLPLAAFTTSLYLIHLYLLPLCHVNRRGVSGVTLMSVQ